MLVESITIAELFQQAIAAERQAEELYRGFRTRFAHHPPVARFWAELAADEREHAMRLEQLRATLSPQQLTAPADPEMVRTAQQLDNFSVEEALHGIHNLEDAYQLADRLENSETNTLFQFLLATFSLRQRTRFFVEARLQQHINKLKDEFPTDYTTRARRLSTLAEESDG